MTNFRLKAPRFNLSALLLVVLFVGAICAAWSHSARRQQAVVRELRAVGIRITYAYKYEPDGSFNDNANPPILQTWFPGISIDYLSPVVDVSNVNTPSTFTDEHIKLLKRLPELRGVHLHGVKVTDDGLARLARLSQLRSLRVSYNDEITDDGLRHLSNLQCLTHLDLYFTQLSDKCIPHLQRLTNLQHLNLDLTRISYEGRQRLQATLPNCTITWKQRMDLRPEDRALGDFHPHAQQDEFIAIDWHDLARRKKKHGANRKFPLSSAEKGRILQLSDIVVNKRQRDAVRQQAAAELGKIGHVYCLPALLQVLRDSNENEALRAACTLSLAQVADRRVIEPLIDLVDDGDVGLTASAALVHLLPAGNAWDNAHESDRSPEVRKQIQAKWRNWWAQNKENARLDNSSVSVVD